MGKVCLDMTMSLDGFINDRNGRASRLYPDLAAVAKTETLQETVRLTGAVVMGRHAYDMANGNFTGYEFQVPLFVLTHVPPKEAAKGENGKLSFNFVTDGIENSVAYAKAAAGDRDVTVIGGASIAQQCIRAGLLDEIRIHLSPVLLAEGLRLFEYLGPEQIELERIKVTESPAATDLTFRVVQ